jgi:Uma2 family endonuclease
MTTKAVPIQEPDSLSPKGQGGYSLEEYLRKEARAAHKHEYLNGKIVKMPYAKGPHNIITANVVAHLAAELEINGKDHIIFASDQKIYFPTLNEGVYADALVVAERPHYWDAGQLLLINPLLVVEVLSKSTSRYDRVGKFDKYKTLESFKEYVLIRQDDCYAEVWYREKPGLWHETIETAPEGLVPLQSIGVSLTMSRIYKNVITI